MSFARFVYIGVTQLRKPEEEVLLTPLGELMDQWELHKQFLGIAKPKREVFIEDIIPEGIRLYRRHLKMLPLLLGKRIAEPEAGRYS